MSDGAEPGRKSFGAGANAHPRSEAATLVCAVAGAVVLGIACGIWINSLLAAAADAGRAAPARTSPAVAAEPRPVERGDTTPPADETGTLQGSVETADAGAAGTDFKGATDEGRALRRTADAATPVARAASRPSKLEGRRGVAPDVERRAASGRDQGRVAPCALYASAGSLTLRGGGAAPLVLGGPGEAGRVMVNTPDWSNIAVLYEGRTVNGWLRYSVRSVSKRPGVYTVRFTTPCGSKTIPVTVTRP